MYFVPVLKVITRIARIAYVLVGSGSQCENPCNYILTDFSTLTTLLVVKKCFCAQFKSFSIIVLLITLKLLAIISCRECQSDAQSYYIQCFFEQFGNKAIVFDVY